MRRPNSPPIGDFLHTDPFTAYSGSTAMCVTLGKPLISLVCGLPFVSWRWAWSHSVLTQGVQPCVHPSRLSFNQTKSHYVLSICQVLRCVISFHHLGPHEAGLLLPPLPRGDRSSERTSHLPRVTLLGNAGAGIQIEPGSSTKPKLLVTCFFFFSVLGFELKAYTLSHSTSPFFVCVMGFFQDRVSQTICQAGFKL
jgi:hypothetical protein